MNDNKGVSLLEILIATVIIALTSLAAFSAYVTVKRSLDQAGEKRQGTDCAISTLEWLKDKVTTDITNPRYYDPQGVYALAAGTHMHPIDPNSKLAKNYNGQRFYVVEDKFDPTGKLMFKKVTVTVKYTPIR